jgi:hypothetical protein
VLPKILKCCCRARGSLVTLQGPPHPSLISLMRPPIYSPAPCAITQNQSSGLPVWATSPASFPLRLQGCSAYACRQITTTSQLRSHANPFTLRSRPLNTSTYDRTEPFQRICKNSSATHQLPRFSRCSPRPNHATTSRERPRQVRLTAFQFFSCFWSQFRHLRSLANAVSARFGNEKPSDQSDETNSPIRS